MREYWGFNFFLRELVRLPRFVDWAKPISDAFNRAGIWFALAAAILLMIALRRRGGGWLRAVGASAVAFLICTPRVGIPISEELTMLAPLFAALVWAGLWIVLARAVHFTIRANVAQLIVVAIIGLLLREALAWFSIGSADASIMQHFAEQIDRHGLLWLYRDEVGFNHPPLTGYWTLLARHISSWLDLHAPARWLWFSFVLKQPMILADALSGWLIYSIWKRRDEARGDRSPLPAIAFALSPLAILLSGFHGNTDPIYAMLCLLAAYLMCEKKSFFGAGLALGLAINVKFVPVLLVPIFAALCRDRKQFARYLAGLALMAIPFFPLIVFAPHALLRNVISYSSTMDFWGIGQFLMETSRVPRFSAVGQSLEESFNNLGRWILLAAVVWLIINMRRHRWDSSRAYDAVALAASIFLILAPGFGLQYLAFPGVLLFAVRLAPAVVFAIFAGLYALFNYWMNWVGGIPIDSIGIGAPVRAPGAQFGLIAWFALIVFVCTVLARKLDEHEP